MIDVVRDPHRDAARLRAEQRAADAVAGLPGQSHVVQRQVERRPRRGEERLQLGGDLLRLLAAVRERADLDHERRPGRCYGFLSDAL